MSGWTLEIRRRDERGPFTVHVTAAPTRHDCLSVASAFSGEVEALITNRNGKTETVNFIDGKRVQNEQ